MKFFVLLLSGILLSNCWLFVLASYEPYGPHQASGSSYVGQSPIVGGGGGGGGGQGWNSGQPVGSYYHYHVPLVGQSHGGGWQPQPAPTSDLHHTLLWLIPLLLLAIAPLALLPLLVKFLLVPLGLSLLALLAPLLMMGMMMMMMMMGGGMMMPMMMRNPQSLTTVQSARHLGQMLVNDWSSILTSASRSVDLDRCPEKLACQLGSLLYAQDNSTGSTEKGEIMSKYIVEQLLPRGKVKKTIRLYKEAFWIGSKAQDCSAFNCQPALRLFQKDDDTSKAKTTVSFSKSSSSSSSAVATEFKKSAGLFTHLKNSQGGGGQFKYSRLNATTTEKQNVVPTYVYSVVDTSDDTRKKEEIVAEP